MTFPPFYFETMFAVDSKDVAWHKELSIITAFETTGERWSDGSHAAANPGLLATIKPRT